MNNLHVICKIAEAEYAIPATQVVQMESYTPVTPVPGAPDYVAGLTQIRQHVVPIIDTRTRFGLPRAEATAESRFVIMNLNSRLVGILVDSAREVRSFSQEDFHPATEILTGKNGGFVKAVAQIKDRIIMLIDSLKVIGEEALQ